MRRRRSSLTPCNKTTTWELRGASQWGMVSAGTLNMQMLAVGVHKRKGQQHEMAEGKSLGVQTASASWGPNETVFKNSA